MWQVNQGLRNLLNFGLDSEFRVFVHSRIPDFIYLFIYLFLYLFIFLNLSLLQQLDVCFYFLIHLEHDLFPNLSHRVSKAAFLLIDHRNRGRVTGRGSKLQI